MSIVELETEVLKLTPEDQARLLQRLVEALDLGEAGDPTSEELGKRWADFETSGARAIEASELRARALRHHREA